MRNIVNPWNGSVVGSVPSHSLDNARQFVADATGAFAETKRWPAFRRHRVLRNSATALRANADALATTIVAESGKTIRDARVEVERAATVFDLAAEEAQRIHGEVLPLDTAAGNENRIGLVRRMPRGPVAAITPFNFPLNLVAHKVAPALAAGCPVVLKPSERTPLTALALQEIVLEAGWPREAFPVVTPDTPVETAVFLAETPDCPVLSFTGSDRVGWDLAKHAFKKKVTLELGGNAGVYVCADAEIERAALRCVQGAYANAGQVCISVQRIAVHRSRFEEFVVRYIASAQQLQHGDPMDPRTDLGPMIDTLAADRVAATFDQAVHAGATPLLPLTRHSSTVLSPGLLTDTKPDMDACRSEVFGPLAVVEPFETDRGAIDWIADSRYGLQAGIFTRDIGRIWAASDSWNVGAIIVDDIPTWRVDSMPYGGEGDSGTGREGVRWAVESMTRPQLIVLRPPGLD